MEITQEKILEALRDELGSIYCNMRFEDAQYYFIKDSTVLTKLNIFVQQLIDDDIKLWTHIIDLTLENDTILVTPSVRGPHISLPYSFDLKDPNSINLLCEMLDVCGGQRDVS